MVCQDMTHPCTIFAVVIIGDNNMEKGTKEKDLKKLDLPLAVER